MDPIVFAIFCLTLVVIVHINSNGKIVEKAILALSSAFAALRQLLP